MKKILAGILLIIISQIIYSQASDSAKITGRIINTTDRFIKIGDSTIPVSDHGVFSYATSIKNPCFFEVSYGNLYWAIYLEPGQIVELEVASSDLSSLIYKDDLKVSNHYLKGAGLLNNETNDFFNANWVWIHSQDELKFISIIDSLKGLFLNSLAQYQNENKRMSNDFIELFKADVNFGFNTLIIQYPEKHFSYTRERVMLSQGCLDHLSSISVDDFKLIDLQSYTRFCRAWIDYNAELLADQINDQRNFTLKKMDVLFEYLPAIFKNQELVDYWLSEYLYEHIQNTWLRNSETYIDRFNITCKTEEYKDKINSLYHSCLDSEKDHAVLVYKTVNGYVLEAHIFYPDSNANSERKSAMVIIHGGGFVLGNPSWAFEKARHYASLGMIAISAQYRLSNFKDITPIDAIQDVKDLMFWIRQNADSLKIADSKIAASGWSVGAQLCATLAILPDTMLNSNISCAPDALVLTSPGTGGTEPGSWFEELMNGAKVNLIDYSPVDNIRPGLPPAIILQGRDDTVTPLNGVQLFHDRLIESGNYCEIWIYDKVGHLFTPTYLGDNGWPQPDNEVQKQADERADEFLRKFGYIGK